MRGKGRDITYLFVEQRITPAYAGKSTETTNTGNVTKDHPRVCGEKMHSGGL